MYVHNLYINKNTIFYGKKITKSDLHNDFSCYFKFMFSKKATKIDAIFTVDLTLCSKRQIDGEDFVNICGLLRKYEL